MVLEGCPRREGQGEVEDLINDRFQYFACGSENGNLHFRSLLSYPEDLRECVCECVCETGIGNRYGGKIGNGIERFTAWDQKEMGAREVVTMAPSQSYIL